MENWIFYACLWFGFVSAVVAGVFLTFSDFVMAGLVRARTAGGIDAMQQLNRTVYRSVFLTSFLSLVPLSIAFALYAAVETAGPPRTFITAAAVTYFLLVFLVTVAGNVPMNKRLDGLEAAGAEGKQYWASYSVDWTRLNHVRTAGSLAAAALYLLAAAATAG